MTSGWGATSHKVLSPHVAEGDRLERLKREARAASALNHPNIVTVYEIGSADSIDYISMELIDGKSLRDVLSSSALPLKRLLDLAAQVAAGLARAHQAGIVHRDLKPENIMISRTSLVKILDFGLAKWIAFEGNAEESPSTMTEPGTVLGTPGYMSPEQAIGNALDFRSDQFSFGSVLYEMATGKRAFERETKPETLSAIIRDDPESLSAIYPKVPAPLRWVIERCLTKDSKRRYASTDDLARDLANLRDHLSEVTGSGDAIRRPRRLFTRFGPVVAAAAIAVAIGVMFGGRLGRTLEASYERLTFRRGTIWSARFVPDGQTILYTAEWEGRPPLIFSTRSDSTESTQLPLPDSDLLSVSPSGEIAILINPHDFSNTVQRVGTLARVSLAGGSPREIMEDVRWAEWVPDGSSLAVLRLIGGRNRLEFPIGKPILESPGILQPRISPNGDRIAFLDSSAEGNAVTTVDRSGNKKVLSSGWREAWGISWSPNGKEVWFTAARTGNRSCLYAVSLSGRKRLLAQWPGPIKLMDVASDGRILLTPVIRRLEMSGLAPGEARERDLTWLDGSWVDDLSGDGRTLLFDEREEGGGTKGAVYLRKPDGSPPVRLGDGRGSALSPDGRWALTSTSPFPRQLVILPTKAGEPRQVTHDEIDHDWGNWLPDGKRIVFGGNAAGRPPRLYVQDLGSGQPRPFSSENIASSFFHAVSPDGKAVVAMGLDRALYFFPIDTGSPFRVPGTQAGDIPVRFSGDGHFLYVFRRNDIPSKILSLELGTGRRKIWKEIGPFDPAGVNTISTLQLSEDGNSYVYTYRRILSDLYLATGLK